MANNKVAETKDKPAVDQSAVISKLKASNEALTAENAELKKNNKELSSDCGKLSAEVAVLKGSNEALNVDNVSLKESNDKLKAKNDELKESNDQLSKAKEVAEIEKAGVVNVVVNHGVVVGGKTYTKSEIEASQEIQEYLVSIGSSAVSLVE